MTKFICARDGVIRFFNIVISLTILGFPRLFDTEHRDIALDVLQCVAETLKREARRLLR